MKRFRKKLHGAEYLDAVLELLGLESANDVPTPSVPGHKEKLMTGKLPNSTETTIYKQCVGSLLYYTQDREEAQYEVSILGSMLGKPTEGSMIALKRVTRYLKRTRDFVNKLELDNETDKRVLNSMRTRTVTGLVRQTRSRNRVACSSLTEHPSIRSAEGNQ